MKKIVISIIALVCLWIGIWGITEVVFSYEEINDTEETYCEYDDSILAGWYVDHVGLDVDHYRIEMDETFDGEEGYFKVDYYYVSEDYTETWYAGSYIVEREYCIENMFS